MVIPVYHTAEMVRALPEDCRRYETVHGELLVTPAPRAWHQELVQRVYRAVQDYAGREGFGHAFASPADISWGSDNLVQPDVFVVPIEDARTMDWARMHRVLLAIEVLSPATARADRFTKRRLYQEVGVPVYWIVDPDLRQVEVWTPDALAPGIARERVTWHPVAARVPLIIDLGELMKRL